MNKLLYISLGLMLIQTSCKLTNSENAELNSDIILEKTTIAFEEDVFDFGTISQGETVGFTFEFENTGDNYLVIHSVKPSCGCTVAEDWPDHPIAPGEGGSIPIEFNSEGKKGTQSKSITLVANTLPRTTTLVLQGEVLAPSGN